uniref:Wsv427-like protein n=1 Tax=Melicertus latisulcatus pemonivirus TaxID=2984278 RepID=A0A9C7F0F5_9VIRU|nr:MAG: wsv427-like protein [Melicertus latisulcatus pemonivirus]
MSNVNHQLVKEAVSRLVSISRGIAFIRNQGGRTDGGDVATEEEEEQQQHHHHHKQQQQRQDFIDFAVTNDPNASSLENVRRLGLALVSWEKSFKNVKQGERDTFLRAVSWMVSHIILNIKNHEIPESYISPKKALDRQVKDILLKCIGFPSSSSSSSSSLDRVGDNGDADIEEDDDENPRWDTPQDSPSTETIICMAQHLFKIWTSTGSRQQYSGRVIQSLAPGQPQRFLAVYDFLGFLRDAVKLHLRHPVHHDRDWRMSCIGELRNTASCETLCCCKVSSSDTDLMMPPRVLRYSTATSDAVITADYLLKSTIELILSPHIHWEWKSGLMQFLSEKGGKMLKRFCKTPSPSIHEENSEDSDMFDGQDQKKATAARDRIREYNPLIILPCAANLWDFCKTERPPSDVRFLLLNSEAPSDPRLTSGAGPWCMADLPRLRKLQRRQIDMCKDCRNSLEVYDSVLVPRLSLASRMNKNVSDLSTIRWRRDGGVLMTNAAPVNAAFAKPGSSLIKHQNGPPVIFFLSSLVRIIVTSKQSLANEDRDTAGILNTISFGCTTLLKSLPSRSKLSVLMSTNEDLLSRELSDYQLKSSTVISSRLPRLF